jgi:hypothetical protein
MQRLSSLHFTCLTLAVGLTGARSDRAEPSRTIGSSVVAASRASSGDSGAGLPFGIAGITGRRLVDPYTAGIQPARPGDILQDLAAARARGAHMVVSFAGASDKFIDADGHFSYDLWKARVDRFLPLVDQLNAYVADGTLLAFYMVDEPFAKQRWGGQAVPMATLDQMGQYSKSLFPDLPTAVRAAPTELRNFHWRYVDVSWAQYTSKKGPVDKYASTEAATARAEGLGLIVGLNISKGGDGSSGFGSPNEPSMSGAEILRYGQALLQVPDACAFISWDNRPSVIERPDVAASLKELASAARAHPETPCRRKGRA